MSTKLYTANYGLSNKNHTKNRVVTFIQQDLSKPNPFGTEKFQTGVLSGLGRFTVYSWFIRQDCKVCLVQAGIRFTQGSVDRTVKCVWFRQVYGLLMV